jgi:hypothetical protein
MQLIRPHAFGLEFELTVRKWKEQEKDMTRLYNATRKYQAQFVNDDDADKDGSLRFTVDETG